MAGYLHHDEISALSFAALDAEADNDLHPPFSAAGQGPNQPPEPTPTPMPMPTSEADQDRETTASASPPPTRDPIISKPTSEEKTAEAAAGGRRRVEAAPEVSGAFTSVEAASMYVPSFALAAAVDDSKILYEAFHLKPPSTLQPFTWYLSLAPQADASKARTLLLGGCGDYKTFVTKIRAQPDGTWIVEPSNGSVRDYQTLHITLAKEIQGVLTAGRHSLVPQVHTYTWLPDVENKDTVTPAVTRINREVYAKYMTSSLTVPSAEQMFSICQVPYRQPHVMLTVLTTADTAVYSLGFHPETKTWFVTDPAGTWAKLSYRLDVLLGALGPLPGEAQEATA